MQDLPDQKKTIIISGYYGYRNLGDDAILGMICRDLSDAADLIVLSRRPKETARIYGVRAVHRFRLLKIRHIMKNAGLLLSGGGSLLQDKTSTRSLLYYLLIIRMAIRTGTPSVVYANGVGPILRKADRERTAKILRNVDRITLRDEDSAGLVRKLCPGKEVFVTADPVFRLQTAPEEDADRILEKNGIAGRDAFAVFLRAAKKPEPARIAALLDETAVRTGYLPVFFAMQEPGDRKAAKAIQKKMREPSHILEDGLTGPEMCAVLRKMRGAVSMRLHALVFGAIADIPLVGFNEDPKIPALLGRLGCHKALLETDFDPKEAAGFLAERFSEPPVRDLACEIEKSREDPAAVREMLQPAGSRFVMHLIGGGDTGGAKTHVLTLLKGMKEQGTRVLLVCFMEGAFAEDARADGIPVMILPRNDVPGNLRFLAGYIRRHHVDIVHSHGAKGNMYGALLRELNIPVITTVHSDPDLDYFGRPGADRIFGTINRWAIRRIPWHECVSEELKDRLAEKGIPDGNVFLIHNAAAWEGKVPEITKDAWRRKWNLAADTVVFGTAARLTPVKDIATLIGAFSAVVRKHPEARLMIAGDGEEEDKLRQLAARSCPSGTVIFTGWLTDTASFYQAIDVNVLTSLSEGFPYAIPEGGIMRCATVATRVGGIPGILTDGREGLLFAPKDTEALAGHMERLIDDPALRERLGSALYEKISTAYTLDGMIRRQTEIYDRIQSS